MRRRIAVFLAACAVTAGLTTGLAAQSKSSAKHSKALIVSEIRDSERTQLQGNIAPLATGMVDQGQASSDLKLDKMILVLKRSSDKQAALDRLVTAQQNAKSSSYHRWLTPQSFGAQFGADAADITTLSNWLMSYGFSIDQVPQSRDFIVFSGTNAQLQQAFQTSMHNVKESATGKVHYEARTEPTLPNALVSAVGGFARLSNLSFKPMHVDYGLVHINRNTGKLTVDPKGYTDRSGSSIKPDINITFGSGNTYHAVGPFDFGTIYNVQPLWDAGIDGTGQSVAVVAKSDIDLNDVTLFRKNFNLPDANVEVVYAGAKPGYTSSEGEALLDAQWSGAIAPKAKVFVVTADDTTTTDGLFLDFLYAIDNNLAPVLSVSWGSCELGLTTYGHSYVSSLWQQASAQGISVLVSSGDAGSAACDQNYTYAAYGLQVNGMASTIYDTAVGGTDLYGSYTDPTRYWATNNNSTTLQSALSYVSEAPWNDSCGNPLVLKAYQKKGYTDATVEALCNDSALQSKVLTTAGGGGGKSNCTVSDNTNSSSCSGGHDKPGWQSGVTGIPADGKRDLPDISFFSGDGVWGSFYVYCESSASSTGTCNLDDPNDVQYMAAGGTSFAAPALAGAVALLNQKMGTAQGLINPSLYKLAAKEYSTSNGLSNCDGSAGNDDASCVFHDVTLGGIAMPCYVGSTDCQVNDTKNDSYGITEGWSSNAGYDLATGIGSANIANLVNNWSKAANYFNASTTTISPAQSTYAYGQDLGGTITVAAASGVTGQPSGDTSVITNGYGNGPFTLNSGTATFSVMGLTPGTHSIKASYAGDTSFSASTSDATSITITKADTTLALTGSRNTVKYGESLTLTALVSSSSVGSAQTGTLVFTNQTTGKTLGTVAVTALDGASVASGQGSLTVAGSQLASGTNQFVVSYAGDSNYNPPAAATVTASYTSAFTLTTTSTALSVPADGSASVNLALVSNTGALTSGVTFSCPSNLPSGLSCVFSPAVLPSGSTTASTTLTVYSSSKLLSASANKQVSSNSLSPLGAPLLAAGCLGAGLLFFRRRRALAILVLVGVAAGLGISGCGSSTHVLKATDTTLSASSSSLALGNSLKLTAGVTARSGKGTPTGSITFYESGQKIGSGTLSAGAANMSTSSLSVGNHAITAVYSGDTEYNVSSSAVVNTGVTYSYNLTITAQDGNGNSSAVTVPVTVH
jgi:hypothetical protein